MNWDILEKLIRLANNNPNDAEANSAARKVCKELAEPGVNQEQAKKKAESTITVNHIPTTDEIMIKFPKSLIHDRPKLYALLQEVEAEIRRPTTYDDVRRSSDPFWRNTYPPPDYGFGDTFSGWNRAKRAEYERQRRANRTAEERIREEWEKQYGAPFPGYREPPRQQEKPKQKLRCKDCGKTEETGFVGPPQMYQCMECAGDELMGRGKWRRAQGG